ncbi:MAG: uracil-DNA glycosylase family protein [Saprospiraceae bacterium]
MKATLNNLLQTVSKCDLCAAQLALGPNPVVSLHPNSKILLISQAPGLAVHRSGIPWADASGKRLRMWLGVDDATFYDTNNFGILPMAFCYPGKAASGDLPPSKLCAPQWHKQLLAQLKNVQLIMLIGNYAQKYYLGKQKKKSYRNGITL